MEYKPDQNCSYLNLTPLQKFLPEKKALGLNTPSSPNQPQDSINQKITLPNSENQHSLNSGLKLSLGMNSGLNENPNNINSNMTLPQQAFINQAAYYNYMNYMKMYGIMAARMQFQNFMLHNPMGTVVEGSSKKSKKDKENSI